MSIENQLNLGKFLQIAFSDGVRNQISQDFRDWEMVLRNKVGAPNGRQLNFLFQTSFGPSAVQYRAVNQAAFPTAQQISVAEHTARYKEIDATIEIEYNLWNRAQKSPAKYAEPLALEIQSKTIASKRRLAADFYGDGTGVIVQANGAGTIVGGKVVVTQDAASSARGHVGWAEDGDLLVPRNADGTAANPTFSETATFSHYQVIDKSRSPLVGGADTVTLAAISTAGAVLTVTATGLTAGDVLYRIGQQTGASGLLDLTAAIADYGTVTEVMAGLESLVSNDGRVIHGITMSGASGASVVNAAAAPLDSTLIQQLMDQVKIRVGQGAYSWKMLCMSPEAHSSLVEARETDRRFHTVEDNKRGLRFFAYQHGNDTLECYTSEFTPKKRAWALPESKAGQKVFEFHGTDFETVRVNDSGAFHLKPASGGGHERRVATYMEALLCLICKHPAAVGKLVNFS
jgi:hypothetical protein